MGVAIPYPSKTAIQSSISVEIEREAKKASDVVCVSCVLFVSCFNTINFYYLSLVVSWYFANERVCVWCIHVPR